MNSPDYTFVCLICGHALSDSYQTCGARCYHVLVAGWAG